ncbi:GNAT family N-acetyltransferase [Desmospora profundinema]|uniref:Ribosomal protein S18 acetylase RimI-like enzyme n=1 Tax=Desmospora profundinema TaxID=1571184 RepID=A0ABU1IMQ6_9BACL|nr:GNAT family N-acetyltransferase [Desmospora profundinema]MDR6225832.1 ribosomal protein S18 acetylase RimI-like enzyme [Desmospora profundinema]
MNLRSFQLSDVHEVTSIWKMTASKEREEQTLQVLAKQLAYDRDLVLVAEKDGMVVGAIVGTIEKDTGYLYCLAVHPMFQGQGVGRELTILLEDRIRSKGVERIQVMVDEGTEKLAPFYHHLGYPQVSSSILKKNWLFQLQDAVSTT